MRDNKYVIALTVMLGTLVEVIDTSVANVSLPHMQGTFSAGVDEITWVVTSYLVANAVILPITGWLGNYFGRKRFYLLCIVVFTIASFGSGAAPSLMFLILMRVIQGAAGGAMVPMSQAILLESFPKEEHGKAMALFGVGVVFGPIIGPTLGGWITDNWGWRWVFYINIPVGMLAFLLGYLFITDPPYLKRPEGRVDYWSFIFICLGLGSLEIMLNRGERYDWFNSNFINILACLSFTGIALFIWRSLTARHPLVDLSLFRYKEFASGNFLMFLTGFGLYGAFTMLPLFLQHLMGYTATWSGLVLSPGGLAALIAMILVGNLIGKIDTRILVFLGAIFNILSLWMLKYLNMDIDFFYVTVTRILQGFGIGFLFVPITTAAFVRLKPRDMGQGTGLFNLFRNEGGSVGIAIAATILSRRAQFHQARLVDHLTPYNPIYNERLAGAAKALFTLSGKDPVTNKALTLKFMYELLRQQTGVLAYIDVFWTLMLAFIIFIPFILLLSGRKTKVIIPEI